MIVYYIICLVSIVCVCMCMWDFILGYISIEQYNYKIYTKITKILENWVGFSYVDLVAFLNKPTPKNHYD